MNTGKEMLSEHDEHHLSELERQNARLNLLISGMRAALWDYVFGDHVKDASDILDPNSEIWYSDELRKLYGYTDETDFPNRMSSWLNIIHPEDLKTVNDLTLEQLKDTSGSLPLDFEVRIKKKCGQYIWTHTFGTVLRDASGKPIRLVGATADINARKIAELEIAEKNEINQVMFNNAPIGLTVLDENFKFVDCNENILKIFGITKEEYAVFFGSTAQSPQYQPDGTKSMEKAMALIRRALGGEIVKDEWMHCTPDGEPLPVDITITRVKWGDRDVLLAYIYDLREQYRLKEEIEIAMHKAEAANKAKSAFLANMSHEIRTPMNAILGVAEILLRDEKLTAETEDGLEKIYDAGNLLLNIINDILDLSKIEAGKLEIIPVQYDIPSLINDVVQINRLRYDSKPIELFLDIDENTPLNMTGDELRVKQIFGNILSNAFKYTERGEVRMSVSAEAGEGDNVDLIFKVSDTGQGMTQKQLDRIFDEYTRFNMEINRTTVGTGLGMSITKRLVDLMGGNISVTSEVNKGSVFTVRLPQKRVNGLVCGKEMAEKLRRFRFQSTSVSKKSLIMREHMPYGKVLVVDDVESNIFVAKGMLLPYGLRVDTALSGFEAIEKIKAGEEYDIIFMDHMMPKMDGIEAVKTIREMGYKKPIAALTANALVGQAEVFLENGFDDYISKPIDSREMNSILNKYVRNNKSIDIDGEPIAMDKDTRKDTTATQSGAAQAKAVLEEYFARDAEKAIGILSGLRDKMPNLNEDDTNLYVVTVHGMKSALVNIGEGVLSGLALRLERAGKDGNMALMSQGTGPLLDGLGALVENIKTKKRDGR